MEKQPNKIGEVVGVLRLFDIDDQLVKNVVNARGLKEKDYPKVYEMLRYNMFTMQQFSELTGKAISTIEYNLKPAYENNVLTTKLDYCFPFKSLTSKGPKFIVRNVKSINYLNQSL